MDIEERIERSVEVCPERWLLERDIAGQLVSAADRDTGRVWVKWEDGAWGWAE